MLQRRRGPVLLIVWLLLFGAMFAVTAEGADPKYEKPTPEEALKFLFRLVSGHTEPNRTNIETDPPERPPKIRRVAASSRLRRNIGLIEDVILIDGITEPRQIHLRAGLATEVGLLPHVRHVLDLHARIPGHRLLAGHGRSGFGLGGLRRGAVGPQIR